MIISLEFCFIVHVVNLSSNFLVMSLLLYLHVKIQDCLVNNKQSQGKGCLTTCSQCITEIL